MLQSLPEDPRSINIADYSYELPDERVARYPLALRDEAKIAALSPGETHGLSLY
ncbi:MAG: hypothetical protein HC821_03205 [Lewinella sp.]|nr:hypothetical protein [Lewinella sp.]